MSFFGNVEDAVLDNGADRLINDVIPGGSGKLFTMIMLFEISMY
jgi:hypothetical protein